MSRVRRSLATLAQRFHQIVALPPLGGYRLTAKRRLNLYLNRCEYYAGRTRLHSFPTRLVIEPVAACNLRCPYCITGAGGRSRTRPVMTLELYHQLLDELGDYLFELEAFHWGEPLLSPHIFDMIAAASARDIATTINTNLSMPFDADKAERLVASGLTELTVSIDGARQATYEQYRVGGDLARVLDNCRRIVAAKQRRDAAVPRINLQLTVFPHNTGDLDELRAIAAQLGAGFRVFKGVVPGKDWDTAGAWQYCVSPVPLPCIFPWGTAVVSSDGGVLACRGAFYREDDMGRIGIHPAELNHATFRDVWNGPRFRSARRFFHVRDGNADDRKHICFDCPNTTMYERWRRHRRDGGSAATFSVDYTLNDIWNYFWRRRPDGATAHHLDGHSSRTGPPARAMTS